MRQVESTTLWSLARSDFARTYEYLTGGRMKRFLGCLLSPGVQAALVYRFGHWALGKPALLRLLLDPVYQVLNLAVRILWGIDLPRGARIGRGLYIGHFGGIIISPHAVIGADCALSHDVTIGVSGHDDRRGAPVIGDDVYIAPGAKLFGRIRVGNNAKIGANAVIHRDVPNNAVAVAGTFKIISMRGNRAVATPSAENSVKAAA